MRAHGKDEAKDRAMSKSALRIIPLNVLFLCTGNSARSIMAEAILSREGRGNFRAFSAGSHPKGYIHPYVLDLLRKLNFDVTQFHSKNWDEYSGLAVRRSSISPSRFCDDAAAEVCPVGPASR